MPDSSLPLWQQYTKGRRRRYREGREASPQKQLSRGSPSSAHKQASPPPPFYLRVHRSSSSSFRGTQNASISSQIFPLLSHPREAGAHLALSLSSSPSPSSPIRDRVKSLVGEREREPFSSFSVVPPPRKLPCWGDREELPYSGAPLKLPRKDFVSTPEEVPNTSRPFISRVRKMAEVCLLHA